MTGADLVAGVYSHGDPVGTALIPAAVQSAGGFACAWFDSETGARRVSLTVVPDAVEAADRIDAEFAARNGETPVAVERSMHASCIYDYCEVQGFSGTTAVNLFAYDMPWDDSGSPDHPRMVALRDEVSANLSGLAPLGQLPALSPAWRNGPSSCAEMLAPEELADALSIDAVAYDVGYAYEESNGWDVALLTAGGFTCRYGGDGAFGGRITVLPDTAAVLGALPADGDLSPIEVQGASASGLVGCWSNGEPFEAGTGQCTVHVPIRGAWVSVLSASYDTTAAPLQAEAARIATAIATALD
ncbi:hypothetical protein ACFVTX_16780 [Agromyces sp. NPDC058136]|uniref:hypothetical protein n=1 Tax=Agromyces sp. NPDC058136 TaxID=3346354 RepID=UPI0036DB597E